MECKLIFSFLRRGGDTWMAMEMVLSRFLRFINLFKTSNGKCPAQQWCKHINSLLRAQMILCSAVTFLAFYEAWCLWIAFGAFLIQLTAPMIAGLYLFCFMNKFWFEFVYYYYYRHYYYWFVCVRIDLDEFKHAFTKMHYPLTDEAATFAFDQIDHVRWLFAYISCLIFPVYFAYASLTNQSYKRYDLDFAVHVISLTNLTLMFQLSPGWWRQSAFWRVL